MAIEIVPVTPGFAAEIGAVDLARLSPAEVEAVKQAFWTYGVLVFPDQRLDAEQHLAFARHFGPHETTIAVHRPGEDRALRVRKEFAALWKTEVATVPWRPKTPTSLDDLAALIADSEGLPLHRLGVTPE